MKKLYLLSLMALFVSNHAHAQAVFGTIPVSSGPNYSGTTVSAPTVHTYTFKSRYRIYNLESNQLQIYLDIFEDNNKTSLCPLQTEAILTLDGDELPLECADKNLTLKLYKGFWGETWLVIKLGSDGDDNNLLDVESKVSITWPSASTSSSASTKLREHAEP